MAQRKSLAYKLVLLLFVIILAFLAAIFLPMFFSVMNMEEYVKEVAPAMQQHAEQQLLERQKKSAVPDATPLKKSAVMNQTHNVYGDIVGETFVLYYFNKGATRVIDLKAEDGNQTAYITYVNMDKPQQIEFRELCKVYSTDQSVCPTP